MKPSRSTPNFARGGPPTLSSPTPIFSTSSGGPARSIPRPIAIPASGRSANARVTTPQALPRLTTTPAREEKKPVTPTPNTPAGFASPAPSPAPAPASTAVATPEMLQQFVVKTLHDKLQGDSRNYNVLVGQLTHVTDPAAVSRWLTALAKSVSLFRGDFAALNNAIFSLDWRLPTTTLEAYCTLLLSLAVGAPVASFVELSLRALVRAFMRDNVTPSMEKPPAFAVASPSEIQTYAHNTIRRIMELAPSTGTVLITLLSDMFPPKRFDAEILKMFVANLLRISEYASGQRDRILTIVCERLINIDVEVFEEEQKDGEEEELIFAISEEKSSEILEQNRESLSKLDALMGLMFEYLSLLKRQAGADLKEEVFNSLLRVFERSVLRTHKSRFTQFLLFYYCGLSHTFCERFLRRLAEKSFDTSVNEYERQSAAAYMASFLSKARFVRNTTVVNWVEVMLVWLHKYVANIHASIRVKVPIGPLEAAKEGVFFSICQAVMCVFSHRAEVFAEIVKKAPEQADRWRFGDLVSSLLNPLRYCLPEIVSEFASVSKELRLVDCSAIIRTNERLNQAIGTEHKTSASGESCGGRLRIYCVERFFPFESYSLKNSASYLTELYISRGGLPFASVDDGDSEDESLSRSLDSAGSQLSTISLSCSPDLDERIPLSFGSDIDFSP